MKTRFRLATVLIVAALVLPALAHPASVFHHDVTLALDPTAKRLRVHDRIRIPAATEVVLRADGRFVWQSLSVDGRRAEPSRMEGTGGAWSIRVRAPADRALLVEARYSGEVDALDASIDHRQVLDLARPIADADGAYLPAGSGWYLDSGAHRVTHRLTIAVPAGYRAVASGAVVEERTSTAGFEATFESRVPLSGIDVMAGPYTLSERWVTLGAGRKLRVRTYFHAELATLAADYLDSAAGYLARYDREIGPYAFDTYNIVSSPLPTGFGMPGIAYLGRQVLRLPFIRSTSLGHEVLHDWWGNGVTPDYAHGNWSEGLTTFLADYAYKEAEGRAQAQAMRLGWLRDFAALTPEQDRPLAAFVSRRHGADQVVGYGKTAFVFFMLRDLIGARAFNAGLGRVWTDRRHGSASWDDFCAAFESASGQELREFFAQWVARAGAPRIDVVSARRHRLGSAHALAIELRQDARPPYRLRLPLRVELEDGSAVDTVIDVDGSRSTAAIELPARPRMVAIDPELRIFRRLDPQELTPILRQVMLAPGATLVHASTDPAAREAATALAAATLGRAPRVWDGKGSLGAEPLLIVGVEQDVRALLVRHALPPVPDKLSGRGSAFAYAMRVGDTRGVIAVVGARDAGALAALTRSLPHLGAQSFAIFDAGRSIERGIWPTEPRRYAVSD